MTYRCCVDGAETALEIGREGLGWSAGFLDFADVALLTPVNRRVRIDSLQGRCVEVSMLGHSFDGFWEELTGAFSARNLEALFMDGTPIMVSEGEYRTPEDRGLAKLALYSDALCILPQSEKAMRLPLCFAAELQTEGYWMTVRTRSGDWASVGKMGYDTQPFFSRAQKVMQETKETRARLSRGREPAAPFTQAGLFRTTQPELFWQAGFGPGCCAVELSAGEDAATYLYRFSEHAEAFAAMLEQAMEAMGPHREIIYMTDAQLSEKPLYRMALRRCAAVRFLRARSAGRLIHNTAHARRLEDFLRGV